MVTGLDLVKLQIAVAQGEALPLRQADVRQHGHAIECRVYAEDPERNFLPSPGRIVALRTPSGPGVRDDSGVYEGWDVPLHYDPMISKLVAWGPDRPAALARMRRALEEYTLLGIKTTLPFFERVLRDGPFVAGEYDTGLVARLQAEPTPDADTRPWRAALAAAAIQAYRQQRATRLVSAEAATGSGSAWQRAGWREQVGGRR
jgi:acetyl-CoA carboxylase biotin carboxylase subunit